MNQKYLLKLVFFIFLFSMPICGNWLFLVNNGELMPISEIVDKQLSRNLCLVGLATRNQGYYYKSEMYRKIKPDILIHGSSRVMQFKGENFTRKMFNSGGAMSSVNEGFSFLKDAFSFHKPKIMIIGIDYWWFNKSVVEPTKEIKPPLPLSHHVSFRSYLLPYQWLWKKKITLSDYFYRMNPFYFFYPRFDRGIGVDGILNRTGFGPDGSYFYTKTVTGKEKSIDKHFEHNLELLSSNNSRFEKEATVDNVHFENFIAMVNYIKKNNVKVIFFIPPLAPAVENKLKNFKLIEDLRARLKSANIPFYDFHDPSVLKITDCEFIDATHGGDLLYSRILYHLAQHEPELKQHINTQRLEVVVHRLQNIAMVPNRGVTSEPEIDFLGLGCDKSSQYTFIGEPAVLELSG